jgi:hypothetical protein
MNTTDNVQKKSMNAEFGIKIPDSVYQKIMWWINKSNFEVSGFGKAVYDEETKIFNIQDAVLLKQENTSTTTEMDANAVAKMLYELREVPGVLWHWHSHVRMGVFYSGTDMDTYRELGSNGMILATVFNQKLEKKSCLLTTTKVMGQTQEVFFDDVPTSVIRYLDPELLAAWDKEYADHVSEKSYVSNYTGQWGGHYSPNYPYLGGRESTSEEHPLTSTTNGLTSMEPKDAGIDDKDMPLPKKLQLVARDLGCSDRDVLDFLDRQSVEKLRHVSVNTFLEEITYGPQHFSCF